VDDIDGAGDLIEQQLQGAQVLAQRATNGPPCASTGANRREAGGVADTAAVSAGWPLVGRPLVGVAHASAK